jgi:exonuclease SbcC
MIIKRVRLENFRSFSDATLTLDSSLTTIVGENNTGKSSIGFAISRALGGGSDADDLPYGQLTRTSVCVEFSLSAGDAKAWRSQFMPTQVVDESYSNWLESLGDVLELRLVQSQQAKRKPLDFTVGRTSVPTGPLPLCLNPDL